MEHELRDDCKDRFDRIDRRLEQGDGHFREHDEAITRLETQFASLTKSMDALTKAIWGASGTALVLLVGFFVWYVQHLH